MHMLKQIILPPNIILVLKQFTMLLGKKTYVFLFNPLDEIYSSMLKVTISHIREFIALFFTSSFHNLIK